MESTLDEVWTLDEAAADSAGQGDDGAFAGFATIDTRRIVREIVERTQQRAYSRGIYVIVRCTSCQVRVQVREVTEALCELLEAAIDETQRGKPVVLDVRSTRDGHVLWRIEDSARPGQDRAAGHGYSWLSVAVAQEVFERHGGGLQIVTTQGSGSTVRVWLPRGRASQERGSHMS